MVLLRSLFCVAIFAVAGAAGASAQPADPQVAATMREAIADDPDVWEAVDDEAIRYTPNGFICRARLGHTFLETVMTAPDGAICVWSDGADLRILVGPKLVGDQTLDDAARRAVAGILGSDAATGDLGLVGRFIDGCPSLTAPVSRRYELEVDLLVAQQGAYQWVGLATVSWSGPDSLNALPGAISLRDAYLRTQIECEPLG